MMEAYILQEVVMEYPHEQGEWTLVSPSGKTWKADAPLKAAAAEQRDRIPATVRLKRIMADIEDCPHAAPFRYCPECVVNPCPIGMPAAPQEAKA